MSLYHDIVGSRLSRDETRDADLLSKELPGTVKDLSNLARADIDVNCVDVLSADAIVHFGELGLSIQAPAELTEEHKRAFEGILEERVFPQYVELHKVGLGKLEVLAADSVCAGISIVMYRAHALPPTRPDSPKKPFKGGRRR
jgi:hypothetical protein